MTRFRRKIFSTIIYSAVLFSLSYYLVHQMNSPLSYWTAGCANEEFLLAMAARATPDRFIILALVDTAFTDLALNMFEASLKPNGIDNFLFVSAGQRACDILWNASLPCFRYVDDRTADTPSIYLSADFIRKMNIRTDMILDAITAGFTVLHTDVDVAFLRNPLPDLKVHMLNVDIAAIWDSYVFNAGFVIVRPNYHGRLVYKTMKRMAQLSPTIDDQKAMNYAITRVKKVRRRSGFVADALDRTRYVCGLEYFENGGRWFPDTGNTSTDYIAIHNNWIVSKEAKIYRFKEHHMWMLDHDGYYTSPTQLYLVYYNPITSWGSDFMTANHELTALKAALVIGEILNRVVILPRFHCSTLTSRSYECPLNSRLNIAAFDAVFAGRYRESTFLRHPKVPDDLRTVRHPVHVIVTKESISGENNYGKLNLSNDAVVHENGEQIVADVEAWFGDNRERILAFQSLYWVYPIHSQSNSGFHNSFKDNKFSRGFKRSKYRQF